MNVLARLRSAFAAATPEGADPVAFASAVRASTDPKFGDYQANGCMAAAKAAKINPRELAAKVAELVDLAPLADRPEVAGPGFLNVKLHDEFVSESLSTLLNDDRLGLTPPVHPKTVVIDLSSPNVAKPMHVGHVRSTVIGESLARIFSALGHTVIRDNHLGDWGSQFGMILWGWKHERDEAAYEANPVAELARLYRSVQAHIRAAGSLIEKHGKVLALETQDKKADAEALFNNTYDGTGLSLADVHRVVGKGREVAEEARQETARLHAGDLENRALWERFMPNCLAALQTVYDRLGVKFDVQLGESFYDSMLADVVKDLENKGLAVPSEGATVVFIEGSKAPFLVRKSDGAYNYATTDLATIKYRVDRWNPDLVLYVVDHRQGDHFKALFDVARRWGYDKIDLEHVAFGTILGQDRRPYKTRDGDVIGLESLLDEAVSEALKVVTENSPELDAAEQARVAEIVGLGAIKYADLSQNRLSDYVFDWKKMMAMNGNTGAYLQYAYARIRSIFRKGETTPEAIRAARPAILLSNPLERALGVQVLRFPETLELAASELKPNILTDYLFDLANKYSSFYDGCPVLKAESPERRDSRLALCDLTARTLRFGLNLLGIEVVERM
ncbi:MAG: arginyl-tRNA synthetase [Planctomycetota bacterium]|nr:arginyl-tRNA synthetase [Planctomycetota bacterium]